MIHCGSRSSVDSAHVSSTSHPQFWPYRGAGFVGGVTSSGLLGSVVAMAESLFPEHSLPDTGAMPLQQALCRSSNRANERLGPMDHVVRLLFRVARYASRKHMSGRLRAISLCS